MQLTSSPSKYTRPIAIPGLIEGGIQFDISKALADVKWTGPKISPAVWGPVLAFFQDTYDRTRSECQVRLYVNPLQGVWAAWAYPQEARTGMSAKELACPDATAQREQFKESEGWHYAGTVHHHCSSGAFQSGTDRDNEQNQDGLHITVGNIDKAEFSIHARFYFSGIEFSPDLSLFWDIGEPWVQMPKEILNHDAVARKQMTLPAPVDMEFPAKWKENLIEPVQVIHVQRAWEYPAGLVTYDKNRQKENAEHDPTPGYLKSNGKGKGKKDDPQAHIRRKECAFRELKNMLKAHNVDDDDFKKVADFMLKEAIVKMIRGAAISHGLTVWEVLDEYEWDRDLAIQAEREAQIGYGDGYGL